MKKIRNPFAGRAGYNCFGCSPDNHHGLKLEFWFDDENKTVETKWNPIDNLQGYTGVLHGGIQATIMDEIASWTIYVLLETGGVTSKMEIQYLKPVLISNGILTIMASLIGVERRHANIKVELFDGNGERCSVATVQYFIYPHEIAVKKLNYPGINAFID
jgi:uncharacterized protein (TIGR00369 family)